jgi:predicted amidohydrolase
VAVTGEISGGIGPLGPIRRSREAFARKAVEHRCYIVVPLFMLEDKAKRLCSNAAVGGPPRQVAGIYRKLHLGDPAAFSGKQL